MRHDEKILSDKTLYYLPIHNKRPYKEQSSLTDIIEKYAHTL